MLGMLKQMKQAALATYFSCSRGLGSGFEGPEGCGSAEGG